MERYPDDIKGEPDEPDMASTSPARASLSLVRHPSGSNIQNTDNTHAMSGIGIISPPLASRPAGSNSNSNSTTTTPRPRSNLFSLLKRDSVSELPDSESETGGKLNDKDKKRWTKRASRKAPPPPVREEAERDSREDSPEIDFELDWERIRTLPRVRLVPPEDEGDPIMLYPIPHPSSLLPSASQACVPPSLLSATIAATSEATDPHSLPSSQPNAPICPPDGVTPNSLAHATFASSQHSHWVGMSDQFILPPPVFSRRTATAGAFGSPSGSPGRGRGAAVVMPKTRRQVEADIGKRMSMVQHRKRESLEIMRNALLPPLEEAAQSPPNVMLPPLEADEVECGPAGEKQNVTLDQMRDRMEEASGSTRSMWRVSLDAAVGGVKSPELPYTGEREEEKGDVPPKGLGALLDTEPSQAVSGTPNPDIRGSTNHQESSTALSAPRPADARQASSASTPVSTVAPEPAPPPAEKMSTRKKRSMSLSASLVRSKSEQAPAMPAPPLPSAAPDMKKQRSLKKLFFPSSVSHGDDPPLPGKSDVASSVDTKVVAKAAKKRHTMQAQVSARQRDTAMSPITAMNAEGATGDETTSSEVGAPKNVRGRSKSMKSRSRRPELVISVDQPNFSGASFDPPFVAEPESITPALTTASTVNHSAAIRTPEAHTASKREVDRRGGEQDKAAGAVKSISKRLSLGNLSAAFKRKSSVPNISLEMARGFSTSSDSSCGASGDHGVPAVPAVPDAYRKAKEKRSKRTEGGINERAESSSKSRTVDSPAWPVSASAAPLDRRRSLDTFPTSESTFPPTILQLLPSPTIRPTAAQHQTSLRHTSEAVPSLPTVRDSRLIDLERNRTSVADYRNKRRGSRFDFDFDTAFEMPIPTSPPGQRAEEVSPRTVVSPISPALASSEGNCLYSSPGHGMAGPGSQSSHAHSSRYHEDIRRESWANGAMSTESGEALLGLQPDESPHAIPRDFGKYVGQAEVGSRSFLDDDDDSDNELGDAETTSIVHAQILPISPTSRRPPYESMQRHLSHVSGGRVTQVEPEYPLHGKRQSVQALILGSASIDGHGMLDAADYQQGTTTSQPTPVEQADMAKDQRDEQPPTQKARQRRESRRPPTVVARRDTEPVVKMAAPLVIDLRGQYARRFTQPALRTGSLPSAPPALTDVSATKPPLPDVPLSAPPMQPTMVPLKDASYRDAETAEHQRISRTSSTQLYGLGSRQTAVHVPLMSRDEGKDGSECMSRSDSASSASTQIIPTTPSSLALLRMIEPDVLSLDGYADTRGEDCNDDVLIRNEIDDSGPSSRVHLSTIPLPRNADSGEMQEDESTFATIDQTFEHDPEMDRLAAELEGGEVNVEVAIAVSHSVIMGSTISASDIASMAHIASLVESPQSAKSVRQVMTATSSRKLGIDQVSRGVADVEDTIPVINAHSDHTSMDDMSDSSSMVLVDSPSIPPEWLASITPPTHDKRARSNPLAKASLNKAAKAMKAATYKGKARHVAPLWVAKPVHANLWREHGSDERRSPSHLSPSPHQRDSPISPGRNSNGTEGSSTPKSGRFPSPEMLLRLLHSPRSRRASADAEDALGGPSASGICQSRRQVAQDGRQVMTEPTRTRPLPALPADENAHVQARKLPHIEGLPRACEVERQEKGQERWTMLGPGQGLELSSACFDALGLDLGMGEDVTI